MQQLNTFRQQIRKLCKNPSFLSSIEMKCSRWNNLCEPNEVISEAYLIGQQLILEGGTIPNAEAWMHSTIWNLIRNSSRKQKREQQKSVSISSPISLTNNNLRTIEDTLTSNEDPHNLYVQEKLKEEQENVKQKLKKHGLLSQALSTLNTDEQAIIYLKWSEGLSWQEVADRLRLELKLANLRQKGHRAKKKLLKAYHDLAGQN